ncbi:hypothetical protein [Ostreibacterium oceani]|uniref:Uncharacterized protein n=1 Tax=Ostreibacterium oceani TaxID=2654998 RepID=A0A6N7EUC5_9GAMM|nr:hypothetical protein [Ostreibacterium oceani]MPV86161.1 hypothetical protein [Ostreibacterium oceani]
MLSTQSTGIGRTTLGFGSYGYEPKLRQSGILARPTAILPGSMSTNMRGFQAVGAQVVNAPSIGFAMGMNSSLLESASSEQLFCNEEVNPDNNECYGISTVSGLQRAAAQGQKIYQIDQNNREQLANIRTSDENMANDIQKAINSGGYVIVPEKAVDGVGRSAIYVYMTHNAQTGNQSWKISGGLNGGDFQLDQDLNFSVQGEQFQLISLLVPEEAEEPTRDVLVEMLKDVKHIGKILVFLNYALTFLDLEKKYEALISAGCSKKTALKNVASYMGWTIIISSLLIFVGLRGGKIGALIGAFIGAFVSQQIVNELLYPDDLRQCRREDD